MRIELNYQTSVLVLPSSVLSKLDTASENDLRVLLMLAADERLREDFDAAKLATALDLPANEIDLSVAFWRGAGVIKTGKTRSRQKDAPADPPAASAPVQTPVYVTPDSLPDYTGKEIEALMKERASLGQLIGECQKLLEKVFNVAETNKIIALVDYLHLSDEYILTLCSYCRTRDKGRVAYVSATARELFNAGIVTADDLERYIEKEERQNEFDNYMRQLLGLGGAKLSAQQKRFFENWMTLSLPREVISYAYEQSVDSTTVLSLPHLNKILENYKKEGVHTLEDAKRQTEKHKEEQKKQFPDRQKPSSGRGDRSDFKSFNTDEFFAVAAGKKK